MDVIAYDYCTNWIFLLFLSLYFSSQENLCFGRYSLPDQSTVPCVQKHIMQNAVVCKRRGWLFVSELCSTNGQRKKCNFTLKYNTVIYFLKKAYWPVHSSNFRGLSIWLVLSLWTFVITATARGRRHCRFNQIVY